MKRTDAPVAAMKISGAGCVCEKKKKALFFIFGRTMVGQAHQRRIGF